MAKVWKFAGLLGGTLALLLLLRGTGWLVFDVRQISSIVIFSMFIYGTLLFGEFRLAFAFGGIALLMAGNLLTVDRFTQAADLDVLDFIICDLLVSGVVDGDDTWLVVKGGHVREREENEVSLRGM